MRPRPHSFDVARRIAPAVVAALCGLTGAHCAKDVVLKDVDPPPPVCGDGVVAGDEECDVASAGCDRCRIVPGYVCDAAGCRAPCPDGVVGDGATCASPHKIDACDMTGWWAGRETSFTRDAILSAVQTSSSFYLYRFEHDGSTGDFHVAEMLHCGVEVTGSANIAYTPGSLRGLMYENRQDKTATRAARKGTMRAVTGGCAVTLERFYNVRGVDETYLPAVFAGGPALTALPKLPSVTDPLTSQGPVPGTTDPDGDGIPGAAYRISGIVSGVRNAAQREWKSYATHDGAPVPANAVELVVPGDVDVEESALRITECASGCSLLAAAAVPARDLNHRMTLHFLGKTRATGVVTLPLREDATRDLETCAAVRRVLPHDPSKE